MDPWDAWTIPSILGAFSVTSLEPVGLKGATPDLTFASVGSGFLFQVMFCAATALIMSGALPPFSSSNLALATLGTVILWMGWFGFNGGSQLYMDTSGNVADISCIFSNTNTAAATGAVVAQITTQLVYKKPDLTMVLNGALAGLVSITAEPLTPSLIEATLIGDVIGAAVFDRGCRAVCLRHGPVNSTFSNCATFTGAGKDVRSDERRRKRGAGQLRQVLNAFAPLEDLPRLGITKPEAPIAPDAQLSDQLSEPDEASGCYRLLAEPAIGDALSFGSKDHRKHGKFR